MARKKSAIDRTITKHGYVLVWKPRHHLADIRGYVYEHRLIAEEKIGRELKKGELIHHIDENKQNNDPENIEVLPSIAHHREKHRKKKSNLRLLDEPNRTIQCACGCGIQFKKYDRIGRPRKYISGHNLRI